MQTHPGTIYQFGPFEANPASGELLKQGRRIKLQEQPFRLLIVLLENSGEVVTRTEIQSRIWDGHTFVDFDSSLRVAVGKLRDALGDDADKPRYIETVPKRGYRFLSPAARPTDSIPHIDISNAAEANAFSAAAKPIASRPTSAIFPTSEQTNSFSRKDRAALAIAAVVVVAVLAGVGWLYRSSAGGNEVIDSIAVLPFVNGSGDPNMEYLGDGIAETLINNLSQLPNLRVMSRESAFRYKGKANDARTVGKALGVRAVFVGRVLQQGDDLSVSAELIDARDDSHIWGDHYDRKSSDIFALQGDIAMEITTALRTRLTGAEQQRLTKSYTANPEAYQLYLQGRFWWNKRTETGIARGLEYFEQAIQKDPNYALAYAGLADCYVSFGTAGVRPPTEVIPKARAAAQKALEIDPNLVEARPSLALIKGAYDLDWSGAERDFQQAIVLNPNYAESHQWYGQIFDRVGRFDEAIAENRGAMELDPLSLVMNQDLGQEFYFAGKYDQAIDQMHKTIELDPSFPGAHRVLGFAYVQKDMYKEAIAEFEKPLAISPDDPALLAGLGYTYAVAGRRAEAREVLDRLSQLTKKGYVPLTNIAIVYAGLGDKDQAFASLQKAYEDRSLLLSAVGIKWNPIWDSLRSDPRFADLLRRANLQP